MVRPQKSWTSDFFSFLNGLGFKIMDKSSQLEIKLFFRANLLKKKTIFEKFKTLTNKFHFLY